MSLTLAWDDTGKLTITGTGGQGGGGAALTDDNTWSGKQIFSAHSTFGSGGVIDVNDGGLDYPAIISITETMSRAFDDAGEAAAAGITHYVTFVNTGLKTGITLHSFDNNVFVGPGSTTIFGTVEGFYNSVKINENISGGLTLLYNTFGIATGKTIAGDVYYYYTNFFAPGTITGNVFQYYGKDIHTLGANNYFLWYDSAGVFRVKGDGVMAYYNPSFIKYTPGLANYERIVQQWNTNVAEIGCEKGGTGTLRALRLLGSFIEIPIAKFMASGTGATTALLATANCPAVTGTAPFVWLTALAPDGSTVYIPAWK